MAKTKPIMFMENILKLNRMKFRSKDNVLFIDKSLFSKLQNIYQSMGFNVVSPLASDTIKRAYKLPYIFECYVDLEFENINEVEVRIEDQSAIAFDLIDYCKYADLKYTTTFRNSKAIFTIAKEDFAVLETTFKQKKYAYVQLPKEGIYKKTRLVKRGVGEDNDNTAILVVYDDTIEIRL